MNNVDTQTSTVPLTPAAQTAVKTLYEQVKNILGGGKLSPSNVVTILVSLMQLIEKYPNLNGLQKKQVVLDAINMLIDDNNDNVEDADQLKLVVQVTLPTVIDTIMSVDSRQLQIKLKKVYNWLHKSCCSRTDVRGELPL